MEQNVEKIENFVAHTIPDLVNVLATIVLMFIIFFSLNGWMAAICVVCIVCSIGLQFMNFFGKKAKEFTKIYYDTQERMSASAVQYVRGMPVVKIFGQSVRSFRQFNSEIEAYKSYALRVCDTYQPGMIAFTVLLNSLITFILPVGLLLLSRETQNIGLAAVYLFFIIMGPGVVSPIYKLMYLGSSTNEIDEGVKRIDRIFDEQVLPETAVSHLPASYDIEFRHVSFAYENKAETTRTEALKDISFTAPQGAITALVGPSGSGKSTVANLIPRFWDVESGSVSVGGVDVRKLDSAALMQQVAFVFQDTRLFKKSLLENIRAARPNASREEVLKAAHAAQCDDILAKLPQGLDSVVGTGGVYLSGGEAQRIALARAILKDAPIVVLDEATAFADPENEHQIQRAFESLVRGKTVLMIAHRLSTVQHADQILVLKDGKIVERGDHPSLLAQSGVYARMWADYQKSAQWKVGKECLQ